MNRKQKAVLFVGLALFVIIGSFWVPYRKGDRRGVRTRHVLWENPYPGQTLGPQYRIHTGAYLLQQAVIVIVFGGAYYFVGSEAKKDD